MKLSIAGLVLGGLSLATANPLARLHPGKQHSPPKPKWFHRIVMIIEENTNQATTFGTPYFLNLTNMGMTLMGSHGSTHPSQPNYLYMIMGSDGGVFDDANHDSSQSSVIDLLEPAGITWKAYMENYVPHADGNCNAQAESKDTLYVRKHNPFMSVDNIRTNPNRCKNIVNAQDNFAKDVALGRDAPQYMFYTPNLDNDAHNTDAPFAAKALQPLVDEMLNNEEFMKDTLIVITFDENLIYTNPNWGAENLIFTVLLGNDTLKCWNCFDYQYYDHISLLETVERNWNLTTIPQADGSGETGDMWARPYAQLRTDKDNICPYAPCSEYYDNESPPATGNFLDQDY